jgi:hypothetical protein
MLIVVLLAVFLPIIALIIGAQWGRAYERSLWQGRLLHRFVSEEPNRLSVALDTVRASTGDSAQLAQAVDAMAAEVQRIGEGQRFLEKLLAERDGHQTRTPMSRPDAASSAAPPA